MVKRGAKNGTALSHAEANHALLSVSGGACVRAKKSHELLREDGEPGAAEKNGCGRADAKCPHEFPVSMHIIPCERIGGVVYVAKGKSDEIRPVCVYFLPKGPERKTRKACIEDPDGHSLTDK